MIYPLTHINPRTALLDKTRLSREVAKTSLSLLKQHVMATLVELSLNPLEAGVVGSYHIQRELMAVLDHLEFERGTWLKVSTLAPDMIVIKSLSFTPPPKESMTLHVVSFNAYISQLRQLLTPFLTHYSRSKSTLDDVIEGTVDYVVSQVYNTPVRIWPELHAYLTRAVFNINTNQPVTSHLGYILDRMEALFWFGKEPDNYRLHTIDVRKGIVNLVMKRGSD